MKSFAYSVLLGAFAPFVVEAADGSICVEATLTALFEGINELREKGASSTAGVNLNAVSSSPYEYADK